MPSLNLDLDYFDHPKTRRLIGLLGRGSEVLPVRLWCYCGKYHAGDGSLAGYSAQEIESIVGWWGKAGEMVQAFVALGFLEEGPGGPVVHDWKEHAGHLAVYKEKARHAARVRWGHAGSIPGASPGNASSIALAGQGNTEHSPPAPPPGGRLRRMPARVARGLVGAHREGPPKPAGRVVDEGSPLWVIGVYKALMHPARPVVPDDLEEAWQRWRSGEEWNGREPNRWRERLEAAVASAVVEDARMAVGKGGGR